MGRFLLLFFLPMVGIYIIDQNIKTLFLDGLRFYSDYIDLILVFNKGVAFSMLAFLDEWLKWLQLVMIGGILGFFLWQRSFCYAVPAGILIGAGLSNVYDRFVHGGVVDYVYWHYGFDFAVFNFADVMIDVAVVWMLIINFWPHLCKQDDLKDAEMAEK